MIRHPLRMGILAGALALGAAACRRDGAATTDEMKAEIELLESERDELKGRMSQLITNDPRLAGLPNHEVRVGVPTTLARSLIERVLGGFVDSVTLTLSRLKVHKEGTVKKVIPIGEYVLDVSIDEVTGQLQTGQPQVTFGGNRISVSLPVRVASGQGDATIDFKWDGKNISGAVCGDMEIRQKVSGRVKPDRYPVSGSLLLTATDRQILAAPKFPVVKVNLKVVPSPESWAAVQKILDEKEGVCGFVLDKVNIPGVLEDLIGKGFNVRLPTEKIKSLAVPVGIAPTLNVRDEPVTVAVKVGALAITEHMIWLGANVDLASPGAAAGR
jgi:hypothetical protein